MSNGKEITINLRLEVDGDSMSGEARTAGGSTRTFSSWLGLIGALDMLVGDGGSPEGPAEARPGSVRQARAGRSLSAPAEPGRRRGRHHAAAMTTATHVPRTHGDELEGDEALETLRRIGRRRLVADSLTRFRAADGFSHSRALAFQWTLTMLPALIGIVGLAAALEQDSFTRTVKETIDALAPGAVGSILTEALQQGSTTATRESGETALAGGFAAAAFAGMSAMAQVERGANRIYGVERDRPFVRKYLVALLGAVSAGLLGLLSFLALVGGEAIRDAAGFAGGFDAFWSVARWPLGLAFAVASVSILFELTPRRRQPEPSWLAFGAAVSVGLWLAFMALLTIYIEATESFGATYGPLAGTIGILLWTFLTSIALFLGLAFAAQLEAVRAGVERPRVDREQND